MINDKLRFFITPMIEYIENSFPKKCSCEKEFKDFKDFILKTTPVGDLNSPFFNKKIDPFGCLSYVNCSCKSTILIKCEDTNDEMHNYFKKTIIEEAQKQNCDPIVLLNELREEIRNKVLNNI
jgi:hypothetical protein